MTVADRSGREGGTGPTNAGRLLLSHHQDLSDTANVTVTDLRHCRDRPHRRLICPRSPPVCPLSRTGIGPVARLFVEFLLVAADLSAVSWILLASTAAAIPLPLRSRLSVVEVGGLRPEDAPVLIRSIPKDVSAEYRTTVGILPAFEPAIPASPLRPGSGASACRSGSYGP
jgi:hypothetical protein